MKLGNDLSFALGGLKYLEKEASGGDQKTDDRFVLSSNFGYKMSKQTYISLAACLKTQLIDGFTYPNDSVRVSRFMAAGYFSGALGLDHIESDYFSVFTSPVAVKLTIVNDATLANAGAFGVRKATTDSFGNIIVPGARLRSEFGAYIKIKFIRKLAKNIELKSKCELFSNYTQNPQNIDVNAEALFNFNVNSWLSASL